MAPILASKEPSSDHKAYVAPTLASKEPSSDHKAYGNINFPLDLSLHMAWCFILEKLVLSKVSSYLNSQNRYNACQSAYRPGHSTEAALLKGVNDQFCSLNKGNIFVIDLFDVSSAFDKIDHPILVHHLHTDFEFTDAVLQWFSSYLTDRTHYVSLSNHCSAFAPVHSGVP